MDVRAGILILFVLGVAWPSDAKPPTATDLLTLLRLDHLSLRSDVPEVSKNENVCILCEEFTTDVLNYLASNNTQAEIVKMLHYSCSRISHFKQECVTVVDYYAHIFFATVSSLRPDDFCEKVDICEQIAVISSQIDQNSCILCRQVVEQILKDLEDPEIQLKMIELLLEGCSSMEDFAKTCKLIIIKYGPLILASAKEYLKKNDVCTMLHACGNDGQASPLLISDI